MVQQAVPRGVSALHPSRAMWLPNTFKEAASKLAGPLSVIGMFDAIISSPLLIIYLQGKTTIPADQLTAAVSGRAHLFRTAEYNVFAS